MFIFCITFFDSTILNRFVCKVFNHFPISRSNEFPLYSIHCVSSKKKKIEFFLVFLLIFCIAYAVLGNSKNIFVLWFYTQSTKCIMKIPDIYCCSTSLKLFLFIFQEFIQIQNFFKVEIPGLLNPFFNRLGVSERRQGE